MKLQRSFGTALVIAAGIAAVAGTCIHWFQTVHAQGGAPWSLDSGIVSYRPDIQRARVHLLRRGPVVEDPEMQPCVVEMRVLNAIGQEIGPPDAITLRPGVAVTRFVQPEDATTPQRYRVELRGVEDPNIRSCPMPMVTMEIFDNRTGETQYMHPGLIRGFNPQPDPPGHN